MFNGTIIGSRAACQRKKLAVNESEMMNRYRILEDDLRRVRSENAFGSAKEEPVLEEMTRLWWLLSDSERETLDREGPTCDSK